MNVPEIDRNVTVNKKRKTISRSELEDLSKAELIDRIFQLDAHVSQLKNLLQKKLNGKASTINEMENTTSTTLEHEDSPMKRKRKFDFSKCHKRHVLLRLLYFGWDYQGFACQEDSNDTIEHHLFQALTRTCLIESRVTSNYHRCGRTDKGVSAFSQVISIDLRSKHPAGEQLTTEAISNEIDYCGLLNRVLPKNIQCIAWMPLRNSLYSARFDCRSRTYRYYFPTGDLNIKAMQTACQLLECHADFRNFCKMDVNNGVTNYMRHIHSARIEMCENQHDHDEGYNMYFLEIKANAFLWHQIRCIMAVLLLIGQGKESSEVVNDLLNIEENPCKPQYTPALGLPLNLFQCDFHPRTKQHRDGEELPVETNNVDDTTDWVLSEDSMCHLIECVHAEWSLQSIKCTMIRDALLHLEEMLHSRYKTSKIRSQSLTLQDGVQPKRYQKLLDRKRCESLDNRIQHFLRKQRLTTKNSIDSNAENALTVKDEI